MTPRIRIRAALATVALAGITVLISGAATPALAQTEAITPQHSAVVHGCSWDHCDDWDDWGYWDDDFVDGWSTEVWDIWTWTD
jgi:hypothetical protein